MSRHARTMVWVLLGLLVVVVAATAWVGTRALLAKAELERASSYATAVQSALTNGDFDRLGPASESLSAHSQKAAAYTSDAIWRTYEALPLVGPNLRIFRELAQVVDTISVEVVAPLTGLAGTIDLTALQPVDGVFNLQPLIDSQPKIAGANSALVRAQAQLQSLDSSAAIEPIRAATQKLAGVVAKASDGLGVADRIVSLAPAMLGADGPRTYLLLFQNNAEVRATGGLPGALALIRTEGGRIELVKQATGSSVGPFSGPVLDLPLETRGIYTDRLSSFMGDVTLTPHFPTTGQIAREMWKQRYGDEVDGVLSLDPVTLSYLLRATGPITLSTGDLVTSENAVQLLLSDVYMRYETASEQDAFFASVASSVFGALASGLAEPEALFAALTQAGEERRILIWSDHEKDQQVLAGTTLTGELPVSDDTAERFGIYLNDATGAKMDTYLDVKVGLGQADCRVDGRQHYAVDITLTNTAPVDAATELPESVTGPGTYGVKKGNIKTLIVVYGPTGAENLGMTRDDLPVPYHPASDSGYPVSQIGVELAPGETLTTRAYFLGGSGASRNLEAVTTPLIKAKAAEMVSLSCTTLNLGL